MTTETQFQGLGEFARLGFTLSHPDDHVVELLHKGELVARFSKSGSTEEGLQEESARHLVTEHGWDGRKMTGTYCGYVGKFERGQMFRRYCVRCVHNTAHLGDEELYCRFLECRVTYQPKNREKRIPDKKPHIRIPPDLRG